MSFGGLEFPELMSLTWLAGGVGSAALRQQTQARRRQVRPARMDERGKRGGGNRAEASQTGVFLQRG
eukprot:365067-Chlamydomonas_euryale.AAC.1